MYVPDATQRPPTHDLLEPAMTAAKEYRLPQSKELKRIPHVVVSPSIRCPGIKRVRILIIRSGILVHGLRPGVLRRQLKLVREVMRDGSEHRVVIGPTSVLPEVHGLDQRVQCQSPGCGNCVPV